MGQWLEQKVRESKYNDRFKNSIPIGMLDYLIKKGVGGSQKMIAKWRCGNEKERKGFWKTEEEKRCRIYELEEGCIEYIMSHMRIKIGVSAVFDKGGKGEVLNKRG